MAFRNSSASRDQILDNLTVTGTLTAANLSGGSGASTLTGTTATVTGTGTAVNAVTINAVNGGIDVNAGTGGYNMLSQGLMLINSLGTGTSQITHGGAAVTGNLSVTCNSGSLQLQGGEAVVDAVSVTSTNAAGGVTLQSGTAGVTTQGAGNFTVNNTGSVILGNTETVTLTGNAETIDTTSPINFVTAGAARTGIILEAGTTSGQIFYLVKIDVAANTITFDTTPATANVAGTDVAAQDTITAIGTYMFIWDNATSLWYPCSTAPFS